MGLSSFRIRRHSFLITLQQSIGRYRNPTNARKRVTYMYHEGGGLFCEATITVSCGS